MNMHETDFKLEVERHNHFSADTNYHYKGKGESLFEVFKQKNVNPDQYTFQITVGNTKNPLELDLLDGSTGTCKPTIYSNVENDNVPANKYITGECKFGGYLWEATKFGYLNVSSG